MYKLLILNALITTICKSLLFFASMHKHCMAENSQVLLQACVGLAFFSSWPKKMLKHLSKRCVDFASSATSHHKWQAEHIESPGRPPANFDAFRSPWNGLFVFIFEGRILDLCDLRATHNELGQTENLKLFF